MSLLYDSYIENEKQSIKVLFAKLLNWETLIMRREPDIDTVDIIGAQADSILIFVIDSDVKGHISCF